MPKIDSATCSWFPLRGASETGLVSFIEDKHRTAPGVEVITCNFLVKSRKQFKWQLPIFIEREFIMSLAVCL